MGNSAVHTKEVSQTNESPNSKSESHLLCAPVKNLIDPRSPTVAFDRTPIEIDGLPIKTRRRINSAYLLESPGPTRRGSFVSTKSFEEKETARKLHRLRFLSVDPRSPSVGIVRTPIQVESTPEIVYHKTNEPVFSPTDTLVTATSLEDLGLPATSSPCTLGHNPTAGLPHQRSPSTVFTHNTNQLESPSNSLDNETGDTFVTFQSNYNMEEPERVATNMADNMKPSAEAAVPANLNKPNGDFPIKKLFGTPDYKELLVQPHLKARTPLKIVSANGISQQKIMRVRHPHGINQEIGLLSGIENTPPDTLNKYDSLTKKKQLTKYNMSLDLDQSTII